MMQLSYLFLEALAVFYVAVGIVIACRSSRPTCRVCIHRQMCPKQDNQPCHETHSHWQLVPLNGPK